MGIVLAVVRFVGDDDDVAPVGQQRMLAAFFIGKEFLNGGEHHAAVGDIKQLAQQRADRAEGFKVNQTSASRRDKGRETVLH